MFVALNPMPPRTTHVAATGRIIIGKVSPLFLVHVVFVDDDVAVDVRTCCISLLYNL